MENVEYIMGPLQAAFDEAKDQLAQMEAGRRLWERDPTLWTGTGEDRWLGWLDAPLKANSWATEAAPLFDEARRTGVEHVVLLGMGGSSLCPEVLAWTFGGVVDGPRLTVLDSTVPDQVRGTDARIELDRTWFIVASKSGSTTEPNAFLEYFYDRSEQDGSRFIAITDPGSSLESVAYERSFRHVFYGEPEIGGRFSALSQFGLVPAALVGIDLERFLQSAGQMHVACGLNVPVNENPGLLLGAAIGAAAMAGRDKMTLQLSPSIQRLGAWIEQLIAESTGKQQTGVCPVVDEPLFSSSQYSADRMFVLVQEGEDPALLDRADQLVAADHPVVVVTTETIWDLTGEFFRWEVATAGIGALMKVNPFDQPNVQESKDITAALISDYVSSGELPDTEPALTDQEIAVYADSALDTFVEVFARFVEGIDPHDYIALCAFVDMRPEIERKLQAVRATLGQRLGIATTLGFGPRFLHSTGQFHKGGPNTGVFVIITCEPHGDATVPGLGYSFDALCRAQALGDAQALNGRGRRVLRCHLGDLERGLNQLEEALDRAVSPRR